MQDKQIAIERLIAEGARHQGCGEYRRSYLCLKDALKLVEGNGTCLKIRCRVLLEAARSAYYYSRFEESEDRLKGLEGIVDGLAVRERELFRYESAIIKAYVLRRRGMFREALGVLGGCTVEDGQCPPPLIAERLLVEGACHYYLNEIKRAEENLEAALGIATHNSLSRMRSRVMTMLGYLAQSRGFVKKSEDYFSRARELCRANSDYYGEAAALLNMGIVMYRRGAFESAKGIIFRAKSIFERIEWHLGVCRCLLALGNVEKYRRRFTNAMRYYRSALKKAEMNGFAREKSLACEFFGEVFYEQGDYVAATRYYERSLDLAGAIAPEGDVVVEVKRRMGQLYLAQGKYEAALSALGEALLLSRRLKDRLEEGLILRCLGGCFISLGDRERGKEHFRNAVYVLRPTGCNFELAKTHLLFSEALLGGMDEVRGGKFYMGISVRSAEEEAWNNLMEAGHLFGEIDAPFWKERTDDLIEKMAVGRGRFPRISRLRHRGRRMLRIEYSPDFLVHDRFAAVSDSMLGVWKQVQLAASISRPVLITGETGTGKELIANSIHSIGSRANCPFVAVNCAAVPDHLFESEFFGHRRGCFTGALTDRTGIFEEANGGTLFLDEIGELTTLQQVKLLRVLQEGKVRRIGDNKERAIDVRIVSATNQDVERKIEDSSLRKDFFYRINAERIHVPALRERTEDIVPLVAYYFCGNGNRENGAVMIELLALKCLQSYSWPGNVRELFALLDRIKQVTQGGVITMDMLSERIRAVSKPSESAVAIQTLEFDSDQKRVKLKKMFNICRGNKSAMARCLGISRGTLYKELRRLGLDNIIRESPAS